MNFEKMVYELHEGAAMRAHAMYSSFDVDRQYPPRMSQKEVRKWLKISDEKLKYYITQGMPVVYKANSKVIDFLPRDGIIDWLRSDWMNIGKR